MDIGRIQSFEELQKESVKIDVSLLPGDPLLLKEPLTAEKRTVPNRLVIQLADGEIAAIVDDYAAVTRDLPRKIGFDGVDVKVCHNAREGSIINLLAVMFPN